MDNDFSSRNAEMHDDHPFEASQLRLCSLLGPEHSTTSTAPVARMKFQVLEAVQLALD